MSLEDTIARPYAKAIFDIAVNTNSIEKWKDILFFINSIATYPKIKKFLSGALAPKYLSSIFIQISDHLINQEVKNLVKILSENQRLNLLNKIIEHFLTLERAYKNILIIELKSAYSLNKTQMIQIEKIFEQILLKKIKCIYTVDNHLLGGITIKINDIVFDLSIRHHLKQLSHAIDF